MVKAPVPQPNPQTQAPQATNQARQIAWLEWKRVNADKIAHPFGFEEKFVDSVLCKLTALTPEDVAPQYPFIDDKGCNRPIYFMIINPLKGYLLPIELDGEKKHPLRIGTTSFIAKMC